MLAYNGLNETKKSVESVYKYTTVPYEIIFVDNGSHDGTAEFLKEQEKDFLYKSFIQEECDKLRDNCE